MLHDSVNALLLFDAALARLDVELDLLLSAQGGECSDGAAARLGEGWQVLAGELAEVGSPALMDLIALYAENFEALIAESGGAFDELQGSLLRRWHAACRQVLQSPADGAAIAAWVSLLQEPLWPAPLGEEDAAELGEALAEELAGYAAEEVGQIAPQGQEAPGADPFMEPLAEKDVVPVDAALVEMIASEFSKVADELTHTLASFSCDSLDEYQQRLGANDFQLENINKACETVGLFGLSYVFRRLWLNVVAAADGGHNYDAECNLLGISLILIKEYLGDITHQSHARALVQHLRDPDWRRPLPEAEEEPLLAALTVPVIDAEMQRAQLERTIATAEDVALRISDEVDAELVQTLLQELPQLTESFSAAIQELIGPQASLERLMEAQRVAHTLKGACNTIGVHGIANLTHGLEAILEAFSDEQSLPGGELGAVLLDASDCLGAMSDFLLGEGVAPEQALAVLQQVMDWDYRIKREGVSAAEAAGALAEVELPGVAEAPSQGEEKAAAMTSLPTAMLDQIAEVTAETGSIGERIHDKFGALLGENSAIHEMTWRLTELVAEMDRLVNIQSLTARENRRNQGFDTLELEQYGEMHTCLSRLIEVAVDVREHNSQMQRQLLDGRTLVIEQRTLQKSHLESVQQLRLVPVQRIVSRCQRIVRQTARMTGKEIELQVSGEKTLVDSEVLSGLADVLMHLLRNAVDHGIEAAELRELAGKPKQGTIRLDFSNVRNVLTVSCTDDGGGLDTARILASARRKGIAGEQVLTEEQVHRLIFHPGFSTRDQASQVSGRGIGMDVIQSHIVRMNGIIELDSQAGEGLTVTMHLPSNQYDSSMILVKLDGQTYALAEHGIEHIFSSLDGELEQGADGALEYRVGEQRYATDTLETLLGVVRTGTPPAKSAGLLFRGRGGVERIVLVDQVIGYRNMMVRPFGEYLKGVYGVLGGVMLGSGQIAPAIDLFELLSDTERRDRGGSAAGMGLARPRLERLVALVVDDSLSARKAAMVLLKDAGFEVVTAIDGLDAIEKIEVRRPDIILTDLEMPRMNGIELTRYLRATAELQEIPVIMITSRSTDKHRQLASTAGVTLYLTKPFSDDDLVIKVNGLLEQKLTRAA